MQSKKYQKENPFNLPYTREEITKWVLEQDQNNDDFVSQLLEEHIHRVKTDIHAEKFYYEVDTWVDYVFKNFPDLVRKEKSHSTVHRGIEIVYIGSIRIGLINSENAIYPSML